jgi:hypothetical protein
MENLLNVNFISPDFARGVRQGYMFECGVTEKSDGFWCTAVPEKPGETGQRGFYIDQTGVIRFTPDGKKPTEKSKALEETCIPGTRRREAPSR